MAPICFGLEQRRLSYMCGIVGLAYFTGQKVPRDVIEAATLAVAHRGPDGQGVKLFGNVAFGHRRLSIIDLATGDQPMSNEAGDVWINYNGEVYNFLELRVELEKKGHIFSTNSDTETIIHAYEEWGADCVTRLRGMFAFAIYDIKKQRLFLARDHFGIKPLYYLQDKEIFAFGSEIQSLIHLPGVELEIDLDAVDQYLWLQYIPAPKTIYKNISKLPPASYLIVDLNGPRAEPRKYWQVEFQPDRTKTEQEWAEELEDVLKDSVRAHLVADVPYGVFLSGGVDSSAILAYMSQLTSHPVSAFSIGFEEHEYDELKYAKAAAQRWGAKHHIEIVRPNAVEILPALVKHYGEPFGDSSAIPTYYVSQVARKYVPMVLSGDGGDEIFAGYQSYQGWAGWLSEEDRPPIKRALRLSARSLLPNLYDQHHPRRVSLENWLRFINYFSVNERCNLWRGEYQTHVQQSIQVFKSAAERAKSYSDINFAQSLDIQTYLPFDILTKVDVAAMMHGLEVRPPFIDIRVVEFASRIPEHF